MPVIGFGKKSTPSKSERNSPRLPIDQFGRTLRNAQSIGAAPLKDWAAPWAGRKLGNLAERFTGLPFSEFGSDPVTEEQRASDELMTGVAAPAITVFHGTGAPKFSQFDWNKIGSGEGAQAYSHGMYSAGDLKVAKQYYDALKKEISEGARFGKKSLEDVISAAREASRRAWDKGFSSSSGSDPIKGLLSSRKIDAKVHALEGVQNNYDSLMNLSEITDPIWGNNAAKKLRQAIQEERDVYAHRIKDYRKDLKGGLVDPNALPGVQRRVEKLREQGKFLRKAIPHLNPGLNYTQGGIIKAEIPDPTVSKMLRWDSSLYEQPTRVQEFLTHQAPGTKDSFFDILTRRYRADREGSSITSSPGSIRGMDIYRGLATQAGKPKMRGINYSPHSVADPQVSQLLNDAGITGTKFLSGFNRHRTTTPLLSPPEAFNYVSFRDYLPKVLDYYPESRFSELGIR